MISPGTQLSDRVLLGLGVAGTVGAVAIGVAGAIVVTPWLTPFVVAGALFVPAYNLELLGGRLHSDTWFALGWDCRSAHRSSADPFDRETFVGFRVACVIAGA